MEKFVNRVRRWQRASDIEGRGLLAQHADADGIGCKMEPRPQWRIVLGLAIWLGFVDMLPAALWTSPAAANNDSGDALCWRVSIYSLSIA